MSERAGSNLTDPRYWDAMPTAIHEQHSRITEFIVYPCEVWCHVDEWGFHLSVKYGAQAPYCFHLSVEVLGPFSDEDRRNGFWYWVMNCWHRTQHRIAQVEMYARGRD